MSISNLKWLREKMGLSCAKMSKEVGGATNMWLGYERGQVNTGKRIDKIIFLTRQVMGDEINNILSIMKKIIIIVLNVCTITRPL